SSAAGTAYASGQGRKGSCWPMTHDSAIDVQYMQQALALARGGLGLVSPNPLVGCVLVKAGTVVGRGYHQRFGGPHAEVHALEEAASQAGGAVLYVNLEPCSHTGKTPPCADAVIQSGVSRVVAALRDPDPRVNGRGLSRLETAGIAVTVGVCEAEARKLNEVFIKYTTTRRPFVALKGAMTRVAKLPRAPGRRNGLQASWRGRKGTVCATLPMLSSLALVRCYKTTRSSPRVCQINRGPILCASLSIVLCVCLCKPR